VTIDHHPLINQQCNSFIAVLPRIEQLWIYITFKSSSTVSTCYDFFFYYFPLGTISQKCRKRAVRAMGHQQLDRWWGLIPNPNT